MTQAIARRGVGLGLAFLIGLAAYGQGMYWETRMTGHGQESMTKMYAMPKMFKTTESDEGDAVIVRLDKELIYQINAKEKTYSEMTFAELEVMMKKMGGKMDDAMAQMQEKMKDMPEEQRKMMEQMMGGRMPGKKDAKVDVKNTGETKTISGFSCTKYVVSQDGKEAMTLWATKEVKDFGALRKDWEEFSKRIMAMNPMGMKGLAEGMKKVDGFPIQTEMGQGITTLVTKVEKRSTPASEFTVPAGYKKVGSKMMEGMERGEENE